MLSQRDMHAWLRFLGAGWQALPDRPGNYFLAIPTDRWKIEQGQPPFEIKYALIEGVPTTPGVVGHNVWVDGRFSGEFIMEEGTVALTIALRGMFVEDPKAIRWWGPIPDLPMPPDPEPPEKQGAY